MQVMNIGRQAREDLRMKLTGGCFCGAIRYETEIDPNLVGVCHCRDCQIFSGSAFRMSSAVAPASFRFTAGEPNFFIKQADSGNVRRMAFCGACGTHLCSMPENPDEEGSFISVRLATADQFGELKPSGEIFCDSRVSWLQPLEGTMQFARMPTFE